MNKKKITYLFGAGASCGTLENPSLPLVKNIPKRIHDIANILSKEEYRVGLDYPPGLEHIKSGQPGYSFYDHQKHLIEALKWLMRESYNHASIDTYAKKLTITNKNLLKHLKVVLSCYFILEQAFCSVDKRYDAFFASLLDRNGSFPDHVRILSWNYDYQFELAFSHYSGSNQLSFNQDKLNINHTSSLPVRRSLNFGIDKLNGTTALKVVEEEDYLFISDIIPGNEKYVIEKVVESYALATAINHGEPLLSFAWESIDRLENRVNNLIYDTEVLVVIGYSFPFFNREVDRAIIGKMTDLERVYFQDLNPQLPMQRFKAIRSDLPQQCYVNWSEVEQFLLPGEL